MGKDILKHDSMDDSFIRMKHLPEELARYTQLVAQLNKRCNNAVRCADTAVEKLKRTSARSDRYASIKTNDHYEEIW